LLEVINIPNYVVNYTYFQTASFSIYRETDKL